MKTNIETERLRIRNFADKDAEGLLAYLAHPRANCFTNERIGSLKAAAADVARRSKDKLQYAVCLKEEDSIIGNLFSVKEEPDTYSVGWNFNECYEGKGYASEAARAFLIFLFKSFGCGHFQTHPSLLDTLRYSHYPCNIIHYKECCHGQSTNTP